MTKFLRFGAAGVAMFAALGMGSAAHAQQSASADARAEVLQPLVLTIDANADTLDFGAIVIASIPVGGTETLVLPADGTAMTCPTTLVCRGTTSLPRFIVAGTANRAVDITLPTGNVILRTGAGVDADEQLELNTFTSSENISGAPAVTLNGTGDAAFNVGGSLVIDEAQDAGIYTGTFQVSVEYS